MPSKFKDFFSVIFALFLLIGVGIVVKQNISKPSVLADKDFDGFEDFVENPIRPPDPIEDTVLDQMKKKLSSMQLNYSNSELIQIENELYEPAEIRTLIKISYLTITRMQSGLIAYRATADNLDMMRPGVMQVLEPKINGLALAIDEYDKLIPRLAEKNQDIKTIFSNIDEKSNAIKEQMKNISNELDSLANSGI